MEEDVKQAIDQLANSVQSINLLATKIRQDLGESAQRAVELEGAADRAVRILKGLQPRR